VHQQDRRGGGPGAERAVQRAQRPGHVVIPGAADADAGEPARGQQPDQAARLGVDSSSEPPGLSTRKTSSSAESVSTRCSINSLMMTTSTEHDATGIGSTPDRTTVRPRRRARPSAPADQSNPIR
jgi:hypothetical protein